MRSRQGLRQLTVTSRHRAEREGVGASLCSGRFLGEGGAALRARRSSRSLFGQRVRVIVEVAQGGGMGRVSCGGMWGGVRWRATEVW